MILELSESVVTVAGGLIAIGATVGGALFATGRRAGKTEEKLDQVEEKLGLVKDENDDLWKHQRRQDTRCAENVTGITGSVAAIEASVAGVATSVEKVEKDIREIRQHVMERGSS